MNLSPLDRVCSSDSSESLLMVCRPIKVITTCYLTKCEEGRKIVVLHLGDYPVTRGVMDSVDRGSETFRGRRGIGGCVNGAPVPGVLGRRTGCMVAHGCVGFRGEPAYVITDATRVKGRCLVTNVIQHSRVGHGC